MTPKEKAKQLIDKIWVYSIPNSNGSWNNAKQCALVLVDEILLTLKCDIICIDVDRKSHLDLIEYWQQIKQEINKIC